MDPADGIRRRKRPAAAVALALVGIGLSLVGPGPVIGGPLVLLGAAVAFPRTALVVVAIKVVAGAALLLFLSV